MTLGAEMTYVEFVALFETESEAIEFEGAVLSGLAGMKGAPEVPEKGSVAYWAFMASQVSE